MDTLAKRKMFDTIAYPAEAAFVTDVNQDMDPLKIGPRAITMKSLKQFEEQIPKEILVAILKALKRNRELMKMMPSLPKAQKRTLICYYQKGEMLQQKRPFLCSTTSRTAAPQGDPRGVPKLFRKCSLKLKRLSTALSIQDLENWSIQDLENLVTFLNTGAEAKPECSKVNIGIVIMSGVILENELPNELLKLLGDFDAEVASEDGRYVLPALELETFLNMNNNDDYGVEDSSSNTNTNSPLSDTTSVSFDTFESRGSSQVSPAADQAQHTAALETVWRMSPPAPSSVTATLAILDTGSVAAPDPELEFRRDLQRRNNLASSRYRAGVRARRAARDQELAQLEAYNRELVTRLAHMTELRDKMKETCLEMVTRGRQR